MPFSKKQPAVPGKLTPRKRKQCQPRANLLGSSGTSSGRGSRSPPGRGAWALPSVTQGPQDSVLQTLPAQQGLQLPPTGEKRKHKENYFPFYLVPSQTFILLCLPFIFETSMFTRTRTTHKECYSPWSTSGHKFLPLISSLLHQKPFWCKVSTRNADSSGSWVLLFGTCYN